MVSRMDGKFVKRITHHESALVRCNLQVKFVACVMTVYFESECTHKTKVDDIGKFATSKDITLT